MHVYELAPIDIGWEFLPTVPDVAAKMAEMQVQSVFRGCDDVREFLNSYEYALGAALRKGWEGDFHGSDGARVIFLPDDGQCYFKHAFAWKQINNGTTYVVSPIALPWLR